MRSTSESPSDMLLDMRSRGPGLGWQASAFAAMPPPANLLCFAPMMKGWRGWWHSGQCVASTACPSAAASRRARARPHAAGSATQVATLVVPFTVVLAWMMGRPLDLNFNAFEAFILTASVLIVVVIVMVSEPRPCVCHMPGRQRVVVAMTSRAR